MAANQEEENEENEENEEEENESNEESDNDEIAAPPAKKPKTDTHNVFTFPLPLSRAVIVRRASRFVISAKPDKEGVPVLRCHCPCTVTLGDISGLPCLLSVPVTPRSTDGTVEAIKFAGDSNWTGINQNAVNRYVEHFLTSGQLPKLVRLPGLPTVKRETKLANSRVDFCVIGTDMKLYLEVKTPLWKAELHKKKTKSQTDDFTSRLVKHLGDLSDACQQNSCRAALLLCSVTGADTKPFEPPAKTEKNEIVHASISQAVASGVEVWQANMCINEAGVTLATYFKLDLW